MSIINANPFFLTRSKTYTPVRHFDASVTSSITESGGDVSQWNDLSPSAVNATMTVATNKPKTGVNSINGLNVLTFDGSTSYLENGTGNAVNSQALSIFFVCKFDNLDIYIRNAIYSTRKDNPAGCWQIEGGSASSSRCVSVTTPGNFLLQTPATSLSISTPYVVNYNRTASKINTVSINGANQSLFMGSNIDFVTNASIKLIGSTNGITGFHDGDLGELIIYDESLPDGERAAIINTLKSKWGIA